MKLDLYFLKEDKKTLPLMLKKMSRVVPETAISGIFKNQNNISSRAVFVNF